MRSQATIRSKSEYFKRSREAIARAAEDAREIGIKSGTGIVIVKNGRVVKLTPEELAARGLHRVKIKVRTRTGSAAE